MERFPDVGGDPRAGSIESHWPEALRCLRLRGERGSRRHASRSAAAHRVSGRSGAASHLERSARPARAESRPLSGNTKRRQRADQRAHETPAAVTADTAKTSLQITSPRRSPAPAAFTAKTPKFGLETTAAACAAGNYEMFTLRGAGTYAAATLGFAVARLSSGPGMMGRWELAGGRTEACSWHQSPPTAARPFSEVQNQFCGAGGYPGRADRQQGAGSRAGSVIAGRGFRRGRC